MNAATATAGPPRIALVGNPNCDKTALFNLLPDARQKVANCAGVTAERKEGRARLPDGIIALVDATNLRLLLAVARLGPTHGVLALNVVDVVRAACRSTSPGSRPNSACRSWKPSRCTTPGSPPGATRPRERA